MKIEEMIYNTIVPDDSSSFVLIFLHPFFYNLLFFLDETHFFALGISLGIYFCNELSSSNVMSL